MRKPKLSPENMRVLRTIDNYWKVHGTGPTFRQVIKQVHYASVSTVCYHVQRLQRLGLVDYVRTEGSGYVAAHTLYCTEKGKRMLELARECVGV